MVSAGLDRQQQQGSIGVNVGSHLVLAEGIVHVKANELDFVHIDAPVAENAVVVRCGQQEGGAEKEVCETSPLEQM